MSEELEPLLGWIEPELHEEFPDLRLRYATLEAAPGPSPAAVRERLRGLSGRMTGARALTMRREAVPAAHRVFFHHIGIDPDERRTPIEAAALDRLRDGHLVSRDLVDDALLIALVETGVGVFALDADCVEGELGIRRARSGEPLGRSERACPLVGGRLVVADEAGPLAHLFDEVAEGHRVAGRTWRVTIFAVEVPGVPAIHVDEALWQCAELLALGD